MNGTTWSRFSPLAGLVYAVLYVVGLFLIVGDEIDEKADSGIVSYYADSGNRTGNIVGFLLVAISILFFVVFLNALRERLRAVDSEGASLSGLATGSGIIGAGLSLAGAAALAATAMAAEFIDHFVVDPDMVRLQFGLGFALLVGGVILSCGLVLAASVQAFRSSALPTWMGWLGLVAVVLAVIEMFLLPLFVIPAWCLIAGVLLATREPEAQPAGPAASGMA